MFEKLFASRHSISGVAALGFVALAAVLSLASAGCSDEAAKTADLSVSTGGVLKIDANSYDFGSVPIGEMVTHTFIISNSGEGELLLGEPDVKLLEGC